jgi:hypothetical protein
MLLIDTAHILCMALAFHQLHHDTQLPRRRFAEGTVQFHNVRVVPYGRVHPHFPLQLCYCVVALHLQHLCASEATEMSARMDSLVE